MAEGKFISYLRVSTDRQGRSGLGLEAQRQAIENYLDGGKWKLLREFVEVESGKGSERPMLKEALETCQRTGAILLIAKLDRLSRNVAFIANLMESGVEFVACDFPTANRLTVHILAAMAEYERGMISKRTIEALKAARARGVSLGNPVNLTTKAAARGRKLGSQARKRKADEYAKRFSRIITSYRDAGMSLNAIARRLNEDGERTPRGKTGSWTATAVRNLLRRLEALEAA
jgi:DNA invertase Pin-like site-specific DNA recombinase